VSESTPKRHDAGRTAAASSQNTLSLAGAAVAGAGLLTGAAVDAATFNVTTLADAGAGSLRQAIADANAAAGADDITFQAGLTGTITLTTGQLAITDSLVIAGPGAANLSVSGNNASRVFYLDNPTATIDVQLSAMTITGGNAAQGAGVINFDETLTLDGVTISGNAATGNGGGLWADGFNMNLTIQNCTISGNTSGGDGGGIYIEDTGGPALISNTTISGNTAVGAGGGIYLYDPDDDVTIANSAISGNSAVTIGGGVYLYSFDAGELLITSSTLSGNSAAEGGGLFLYGVDMPFLMESSTVSGNQATAGDGGGVYLYTNSAASEFRHSTIAANSATGTGGGLFNNSGDVTVVHTLLGDNTAASNADAGGTGTFLVANSLIEAPGTAVITNNGGNVLNLDPQLGALANNGGTTLTHLPGATSPAINAGDAAFAPPPASDQRGSPRVAGGRIDIGSVEGATGTVQFALAADTVAEEAGTINLLVNRTGGSDGAASVDYATTPGTATAASDYTTTNGTLNWANGDVAPKTITVPILDDAVPEATESFTVTLSNASGATLGATTVSTVSITDTDVLAGMLEVAAVTATVDESAGTLNVQVNRVGGSGGAASVQYTTNPGTALAGTDYTTTTGTLNWADGDAAPKTIIIPIIDDTMPELAEMFTVTLSNATGAILGANTTTAVTITDTDAAQGQATAIPTIGPTGKLALGLGMGLLAWLGLRRKRVVQAIAPVALGLALITSSADTLAADARPQAQHTAGTYASSSVVGAQSNVTLVGGLIVAIDTEKLSIKDTRRRAPAAALTLATIQSGTPMTVKTKFNADGSVRKVVVRLYNTLAEAEREISNR